jgi:predicted transcriptional regulator
MDTNTDANLLEYVRAKLEGSRGNWPAISEATGVPYFTITNLVQGKVEDPRVSTIQKLIDYFREQERGAKAA